MLSSTERQRQITAYHQQAKRYLDHPPHPKLRSLALGFYEKALKLDPHHVETLLALAKAWHRFGHTDKALAYCNQALSVDSTSVHARFLRCTLQIPFLEQSIQELDTRWQTYEHHLRELVQWVEAADNKALTLAATVLQTVRPRLLPYKGKELLEFQSLWGEIVHKVLSAVYTSNQLGSPPRPPLPPGERIRVGFVSQNFNLHSDWKMLLRGWMSQIDGARFALFGYHLGDREDQATALARSLCVRFVQGERSFDQWWQTIAADRPHVLIYPEIGLNKLTTPLAGLRLAPVQCTSWGNPLTSGLATVDYFLSSELAEPDNGDAHYTEKVVRLPFLSTHFTPMIREIPDLSRDDFALRPEAVVYLCVQAPVKYLPQYDHVLARIAQRVGNCQFVFTKRHIADSLVKRFEERLKRAFAAYGLDHTAHIVMLPWQSTPHYYALIRLADLFLDSFHYSGATSTMETAVAYSLPVVTLPGRFVRGRQSYAILRGLGITETIAASVDEYVELATRLGTEPRWREAISRRIHENKRLVYQDQRCIRGLEQFLEHAVHRALAGLPPEAWPS